MPEDQIISNEVLNDKNWVNLVTSYFKSSPDCFVLVDIAPSSYYTKYCTMEFFNHNKIAKISQIFFPLIFSRKDARLFALDDTNPAKQLAITTRA